MNSIKKTPFVFALSMGVLICALSTYRWYSLRNEPFLRSPELISAHGRMYLAGSQGKYPILKVSQTQNAWVTVGVKGFLGDMLPTQTSYSLEGSVEHTIWLKEIKHCLDCDHSYKLEGFYYSHDDGQSWHSLPWRILWARNAVLNFYSDKSGELITIERKDETKRTVYKTNDGGETWILTSP